MMSTDWQRVARILLTVLQSVDPATADAVHRHLVVHHDAAWLGMPGGIIEGDWVSSAGASLIVGRPPRKIRAWARDGQIRSRELSDGANPVVTTLVNSADVVLYARYLDLSDAGLLGGASFEQYRNALPDMT